MKNSNLKIFLLIAIAGMSIYFTGNSSFKKMMDTAELPYLSEPKKSLIPFSPGDDKFMLGAFKDGMDLNFSYISDTLGFNLWHLYTGNTQKTDTSRAYPTGWLNFVSSDTLFADSIDYVPHIIKKMNEIGSHNMMALMMRPKIEWLCYGQRSDYQCEDVSPASPLWFYAFNERQTGRDVQDSNTMVRYCKKNSDEAGWVVKRLKANTEQSNNGNYRGDAYCKWFVKPKIRIPYNIVTSSPEAKICRVVVIAEDGKTILKDTDIKAKYFKNSSGSYTGRYIEEFNFPPDTNLTIKGNWGRNDKFHARGEQEETSRYIGNRSDIQIYWYGECDMWIDYVRVDNDVADGLFKGLYDKWLRWEGGIIKQSPGSAYNFYIELFDFNNIPCMSYTAGKLDSIVYNSPAEKHVNLLCIPATINYACHVPWADRMRVYNAENIKENLIDKLGAHQFLLASYPFNSARHYREKYNPPYETWSRIPNTLPRHTGTGTLARDEAPLSYDNWLQSTLDSIPYSFEEGYTGEVARWPGGENDPGGLRYTLQLGDKISKSTGLPFIFNLQAHLWFNGGFNLTNEKATEETDNFGEVQREPTNEELNLTANLAIAYGAKGLIYFQYTSEADTGTRNYDRGIVEPNRTPRYKNVYGQYKWKQIIDISDRVKKWEPYVMSFDNINRHSYIYRTENNIMRRDSYVEDLVSSFNGIDETVSKRYLQLSVFKDNSGINYFMVVNRRCSPIMEGREDGSRNVKILFDINDAAFSNANRWRIIDLYTNGFVSELDKKNIGNIDLGLFQPGEGKLYKLEKVN